MDPRTSSLSRRRLLQYSGAAAAVAFTPPLISTRANAQTALVETPYFQAKVDAGELPPIAERLPATQFVVGPGVLIQEEYMTWEDGKQGGDINVATTGGTAFLNIGYGATILRSPSQQTDVSLPNVVEECTPNDDFTVFTFKMREGLRWSDGEPLTTADITFTFEDVYGYPDLERAYPTELFTEGDSSKAPAKLDVTDDYTFSLTFDAPYGYFVAALNSWIPGYDLMFKPAHYLKQFHAKYADKADLDKLVADAGVATWAQLFNTKDLGHWSIGETNALGLPTLNAWVLSETTETRTVFERNPYYWHVDSKGQQLPYADRVVNNIVVDSNAVTNSILAGQVTLASGGQVALNNMAIYKQNADKAKMNIFMSGSFNNPICLFINRDFDYENPEGVWQTLMSDPDQRFHQALAATVDPNAINQAVYFGLFGDPYFPNMVHDVDQANALLDELGLAKDGTYRRDPNGEDFILELTNPGEAPDFTPVAELLKEQFAAVGLNLNVNNTSYELFDQRKQANELTLSMHWNDGPGWPSGISEDYLPMSKGPWSPMTWMWYSTNGEQGREPDAMMKEFYDIHSSRKSVPPMSEEGAALWEQMMTWFESHYPFIPTAGQKVAVNMYDKRLKNVPNEGAPFELDTYINAEAMWFGE